MDMSHITDLCMDADQAVQQVRATFKDRIETFELLDRFWCLKTH
jgi:hypothetical protein